MGVMLTGCVSKLENCVIDKVGMSGLSLKKDSVDQLLSTKRNLFICIIYIILF